MFSNKESVALNVPSQPLNFGAYVATMYLLKDRTNCFCKFLSRVFQSFRIFVNNELEELNVFLNKVINYLDINGVIVVISFHSLEDRIVKRFFNGITSDSISKQIPLKTSELKNIKFVNLSKPIKPTFDEVKNNPRARSAIMRAAKKINL